jgi:FKBP-type peptidyl-prolyl cis-trans isomerase
VRRSVPVPTDDPTPTTRHSALDAGRGARRSPRGGRAARRLLTALVVPLVLLAAACGGGSNDSSGGVPKITAGAKFGAKPTIAKGSGKAPDQLLTRTAIKGKGKVVKAGDIITANYLGQLYTKGTVFDNSYDQGTPITTVIGKNQVIKGWDKTLVGQTVGSRIEMVIPPTLGYGKQAVSTIPPNSTLVFVVDIVGTRSFPTSAKGSVVPQTDASLPKVGTNTDGKQPTITVPKGKKPPTKLVSDYIIKGDGKTVKSSDTVVINYYGVLWSNGKKIDSSYERGAVSKFAVGSFIKGWKQGLSGKKVGSRVLLVVPPSLAYGKTAQSNIPANSTLVFSVDILGIW